MARNTNTAVMEQPVGENRDARNAEGLAEIVQNAASLLKGGFGTGADFRNDSLDRRIINQIFRDEMTTFDLGENDRTIDEVFGTVTDDLGKRADEIGAEIGKRVAEKLHALFDCATRQVTLKRGVIAIDLAKAYANWRPSAKLVNATFFGAV